MDLNNYVVEKIKEVGKNVVTHFNEEILEDGNTYAFAYFKFSDGKKLRVPFYISSDDINFTFDDMVYGEYDSGYGVNLHVFTGYKGISVSYDSRVKYEGEFYARFDESADASYSSPLTEVRKENISNLVDYLYNESVTMEYDYETTRSLDNLNMRASRERFLNRLKEEIDKIVATGEENVVIPSVVAAVDWWAEQFTLPSLGGSLGNDFNSFMGMAMLDQVYQQSTVTDEQIAIFKDALSKLIMNELSKGDAVYINVDYHPMGILREAMEVAGIDNAKAPVKSGMSVGVDTVRVSAGYGAKGKEIYTYNDNEIIKGR